MANMLCTEFRKGTFGHVELCYTVFNSMLSQQPEVFSMLPMADIREESGGKIETKNLILYEPDGETVFDAMFRNIWQDWFMVVSRKYRK